MQEVRHQSNHRVSLYTQLRQFHRNLLNLSFSYILTLLLSFYSLLLNTIPLKYRTFSLTHKGVGHYTQTNHVCANVLLCRYVHCSLTNMETIPQILAVANCANLQWSTFLEIHPRPWEDTALACHKYKNYDIIPKRCTTYMCKCAEIPLDIYLRDSTVIT